MSTDSPYAAGCASTRSSGTDDEEELLFDQIQADPEICNNCFRRYCRVYPVHAVWLNGISQELRPSLADVVTPEYYPNRDCETLPRDPVTRGTRQVCPCGHPRGATTRPLSKREFMDHATRLYERLCEATSLALSRQLFLTECYRMKSDPAAQFADDRLFAKATRATRLAAASNASRSDSPAPDSTR